MEYEIVTELFVSAIIEAASYDNMLAIEELGPKKFDKMPKKAELPQLVEECRLEGSESAIELIMNHASKLAAQINEAVCEDSDPEPLARILAQRLYSASDETRRMVWQTLVDELGKVVK